MEFGFEDSITTADEIFASQQLFTILKAFDNSYFNELHAYQTLDFHDEYDEITDEEESTGDGQSSDDEESTDEEENIDDYDENQSSEIQNNFTLEEMQRIVEWVDQHPNKRIASIKRRFRKVKYMYYITRFRQYIQMNGTRSEKLKEIKEFMWNEFYLKRAIEKEAVHDSDLELFAIQKARELDWDDFKASQSFIKLFKKEYGISSRRYNKLITRVSSTRNICTLKGI
jgi:predicted transcriptional regulator